MKSTTLCLPPYKCTTWVLYPCFITFGNEKGSQTKAITRIPKDVHGWLKAYINTRILAEEFLYGKTAPKLDIQFSALNELQQLRYLH